MTVRYSIEVFAVANGKLEARMGDHTPDDDQLEPFDPDDFGVGMYVVDGAKTPIPKGEMDPGEMKEWFVKLDGSPGKEVGKMTIYRVRQTIVE